MARVIRKLNAPEWTARRAAKAGAASAHATGQNVPALRDRVDRLEKALGIVPAAK